jgi:hypothetical protein
MFTRLQEAFKAGAIEDSPSVDHCPPRQLPKLPKHTECEWLAAKPARLRPVKQGRRA